MSEEGVITVKTIDPLVFLNKIMGKPQESFAEMEWKAYRRDPPLSIEKKKELWEEIKACRAGPEITCCDGITYRELEHPVIMIMVSNIDSLRREWKKFNSPTQEKNDTVSVSVNVSNRSEVSDLPPANRWYRKKINSGARRVGVWLDLSNSKKLNFLSVITDKTETNLIIEGILDLLQKYKLDDFIRDTGIKEL